MAIRYTTQQMTNMSRLFHNGGSADRLFDELTAEATNAGVQDIAETEGLTFTQWQIVRDHGTVVRAAVLAADPDFEKDELALG
jgi:hypothetical protein